MKRILFGFLLSFGLGCFFTPAQSQVVNVVARAKPAGQILLRWVPGDETVWQQGNQSGYLIERTTLKRNGVLLATPETVNLTPQPLKPAVTAQWQPYLLPDSLAHQALYESLYSPDPTIVPDTTNKLEITQDSTTASEQRYFFAMVAADQSYSAARLAALGFTDQTAQTGEQYRYRIRVAAQPGITPGDVIIGLSDALPLLPIARPILRFDPQQAVLQWPADTTVRGFNSYWVERSTDGQTFAGRNALPLLSDGAEQDTISYQDSLPKKRQVFYYRLRGKTIFDEWGYSPVVFGQSKSPVSFSPRITQATIPSAGTLEVHWQFPADTVLLRIDTLIQNFWIGASPTADGAPVRLKVNLAPTDTSTIISQYGQKIAVNGPQYITVVAMSLDGDTLRSYPVLVQPADSLPPAIPTGLRGTIDLTGRVQIQWDPNTESDLLGYKIFSSEREGDEPSSRNGEPVPMATWADTVALNQLNRDLLYYVQAVDQQFNQSALSLPLKLARPDTLRPASPWIKSYKRTDAGVDLRWANSASTDVVRHTLYRKALTGADTTWQVVRVFTAGDTTYRDEPLVAPGDYAYNIVAEDAGKLQSLPLEPLLVSLAVRSSVHPPMTVLNATGEASRNAVRLDWRYTDPTVVKYELYRAEGTSALAPWQFISAPQTTTWDERVKADSTYRYAIRAIFRDGSVTGWQSQTLVYHATDTLANEAPIVASSLPDQRVNQGETVSWSVPSGTFTDPDGTIVQVRIVAAGLPSGLIASGTTLSGQPTQSGTYTITVRAEDNAGLATSTTFQLRVNARPLLRLDSLVQVVTVGKPFSYSLATDVMTDTDGQVTELGWESGNFPAGVQGNGLTLTGTLASSGRFPIRIRALDNDGALTIDTLVLVANHPPSVVTTPASQTALWKEPYRYVVPGTVFRDDDGSIVSVVVLADSLPPGLAASGPRLEGVPTQPGQYPIRLVATDNRGASTEVQWTLTIGDAPNQPPVVDTPLQVLLVAAGETLNYTVPATTFYDPDGPIASITITGTLPAGLSALGGQLSGIPTVSGSTTLTVTATDAAGSVVSTSWVITVINTTQTPIITGNTTICSGQSTVLTATNCGGTINWSTGAAGTSIPVSPAVTTTYTATCTAGGVAGSSSGPVVVTVQAAFTVTTASNSPVTVGQPLNLSAIAPAGALLQWSGPNGFTATGASVSIPVAGTIHGGNYSVTATTGVCSTTAMATVVVSGSTSFSVCIEAEDAILTTGTGTMTTDAAASQSKFIGNYSNSSTNRRFTFSNLPLAGSYQLQIRYLTPEAAPQATLLINEGIATITLPQSSTTWSGSFRTHTSARTFKLGDNSIRIQGNGTGSFALDQVCLVRCNTPSAPTLTSATVCAGQSATLVASGCEGSVVWNTGATTTSFVISPAATTSYTATCQVGGGCVSLPAIATVTVNPAVLLNAGSNSPVVTGQTLSLTATASAGATYGWTGPGGFTSAAQNPTIPVATSVHSGTYQVTASVGNCTAGVSVSVMISASSSYSVCMEAEDATLTTGTGTVTTDAAASGGQRIGNYSNSSTNRRFTLNTVPLAGSYQIQIRYYTTATGAQAAVLVNEQAASVTTLSNAGANGYSSYTLTKNLNQGTNSIRIQGNGTGSFALDRVCVVKL
ncbi:putative Ig domain-containing protein [Larkinella sp.]|uniref:putative Ig domain-containing protein n=1 Tax=Larkinella sp. TaxID=2034517 RepID=UPI003BA8D7A1